MSEALIVFLVNDLFWVQSSRTQGVGEYSKTLVIIYYRVLFVKYYEILLE